MRESVVRTKCGARTTVYLIDKQGCVRTYWMGEFKWQGTDGEKIIREQIEELLSEDERR